MRTNLAAVAFAALGSGPTFAQDSSFAAVAFESVQITTAFWELNVLARYSVQSEVFLAFVRRRVRS
jgi:hypothetical protein